MTFSFSSSSICFTSLALISSNLVSSSDTGLGLANGGSASLGAVAELQGVPAAGSGADASVDHVVGGLVVVGCVRLADFGVGLCDTPALLM